MIWPNNSRPNSTNLKLSVERRLSIRGSIRVTDYRLSCKQENLRFKKSAVNPSAINSFFCQERSSLSRILTSKTIIEKENINTFFNLIYASVNSFFFRQFYTYIYKSAILTVTRPPHHPPLSQILKRKYWTTVFLYYEMYLRRRSQLPRKLSF